MVTTHLGKLKIRGPMDVTLGRESCRFSFGFYSEEPWQAYIFLWALTEFLQRIRAMRKRYEGNHDRFNLVWKEDPGNTYTSWVEGEVAYEPYGGLQEGQTVRIATGGGFNTTFTVGGPDRDTLLTEVKSAIGLFHGDVPWTNGRAPKDSGDWVEQVLGDEVVLYTRDAAWVEVFDAEAAALAARAVA